MNGRDPRVPTRVLINNLSGLVARTVIDDNPLDRPDRLAYDELEGLANVLFLIPYRRNDDVFPSGFLTFLSRFLRSGRVREKIAFLGVLG